MYTFVNFVISHSELLHASNETLLIIFPLSL